MIDILLKHVIGEVAINTLFDKINDNFIKPKLESLLRDSVVILSPYTTQMKDMQEDIKYFERMRDNADSRSTGSGNRYDNMINSLKDAEGIYYRYITVRELDSLSTRHTNRSNEKRVWPINVNYNPKTGNYVDY